VIFFNSFRPFCLQHSLYFDHSVYNTVFRRVRRDDNDEISPKLTPSLMQNKSRNVGLRSRTIYAIDHSTNTVTLWYIAMN